MVVEDAVEGGLMVIARKRASIRPLRLRRILSLRELMSRNVPSVSRDIGSEPMWCSSYCS